MIQGNFDGDRWPSVWVQAGGVPAVQDYRDFADIISFQDRVDLHHVVLQDVAAGTYYIAVYNNNAYFKVRPY